MVIDKEEAIPPSLYPHGHLSPCTFTGGKGEFKQRCWEAELGNSCFTGTEMNVRKCYIGINNSISNSNIKGKGKDVGRWKPNAPGSTVSCINHVWTVHFTAAGMEMLRGRRFRLENKKSRFWTTRSFE